MQLYPCNGKYILMCVITQILEQVSIKQMKTESIRINIINFNLRTLIAAM